MSWKPADTYVKDLMPGVVYIGEIEKIEGGARTGYLEITFRIEGAPHRERRYLTTGALPWTQRFMSSLYYATVSEDLTVEVFENAAEHEKNLKGKPLKLFLKNKKDRDGNVSNFLEVSLVNRVNGEITFGPRGGAKGGKSSRDFDGGENIRQTDDDGDKIPF